MEGARGRGEREGMGEREGWTTTAAWHTAVQVQCLYIVLQLLYCAAVNYVLPTGSTTGIMKNIIMFWLRPQFVAHMLPAKVALTV